MKIFNFDTKLVNSVTTFSNVCFEFCRNFEHFLGLSFFRLICSSKNSGAFSKLCLQWLPNLKLKCCMGSDREGSVFKIYKTLLKVSYALTLHLVWLPHFVSIDRYLWLLKGHIFFVANCIHIKIHKMWVISYSYYVINNKCFNILCNKSKDWIGNRS